MQKEKNVTNNNNIQLTLSNLKNVLNKETAILSFSFLLVISNVVVYKGHVSQSSKFNASCVHKISLETYVSIMKVRNVSCNFARDLRATFTEFTLYCKLIKLFFFFFSVWFFIIIKRYRYLFSQF